MKTRWDTEEKALIEVFGCGSVENRVIEAFPGKEKDFIHSAFYHDGNSMEGALIEMFGCISLDKVINLNKGKGMKKARLPIILEDPTALVVGLA
ncbi:MAG: hypothetical protein A4E64_01193 [Syntrophorhabdus sp. PtaU1.Bin058]|nr:MAG: hypothetical protein A4E64_01193 [Syntrophorhabdus sp. PtaU1.Bin058]